MPDNKWLLPTNFAAGCKYWCNCFHVWLKRDHFSPSKINWFYNDWLYKSTFYFLIYLITLKHAPWFSSEILALYKSLTYLLTWPGTRRRRATDCLYKTGLIQSQEMLIDCTVWSTMTNNGNSATLPGCRPATFVWYAVQTTSQIVTHWPARCPSVAVFNCWRPSFRCGWCSTMEQSATWHRREWHAVTVPLRTAKHFYLDSHILLFCFSFSLWFLWCLLRPC